MYARSCMAACAWAREKVNNNNFTRDTWGWKRNYIKSTVPSNWPRLLSLKKINRSVWWLLLSKMKRKKVKPWLQWKENYRNELKVNKSAHNGFSEWINKRKCKHIWIGSIASILLNVNGDFKTQRCQTIEKTNDNILWGWFLMPKYSLKLFRQIFEVWCKINGKINNGLSNKSEQQLKSLII